MKNVVGLSIKHDGYPEISEVRSTTMGSREHFKVEQWPGETSNSTDDSDVKIRTNQYVGSAHLPNPTITNAQDNFVAVRRNYDEYEEPSHYIGKEDKNQLDYKIAYQEKVNGISNSHQYIDWEGAERVCTIDEPTCEYHVQLLIDFHELMARIRDSRELSYQHRETYPTILNPSMKASNRIHNHISSTFSSKSQINCFPHTSRPESRQVGVFDNGLEYDSRHTRSPHMASSSTQELNQLRSQSGFSNSNVPSHKWKEWSHAIHFHDGNESLNLKDQELLPLKDFPPYIDALGFQKLLEEERQHQLRLEEEIKVNLDHFKRTEKDKGNQKTKVLGWKCENDHAIGDGNALQHQQRKQQRKRRNGTLKQHLPQKRQKQDLEQNLRPQNNREKEEKESEELIDRPSILETDCKISEPILKTTNTSTSYILSSSSSYNQPIFTAPINSSVSSTTFTIEKLLEKVRPSTPKETHSKENMSSAKVIISSEYDRSTDECNHFKDCKTESLTIGTIGTNHTTDTCNFLTAAKESNAKKIKLEMDRKEKSVNGKNASARNVISYGAITDETVEGCSFMIQSKEDFEDRTIVYVNNGSSEGSHHKDVQEVHSKKEEDGRKRDHLKGNNVQSKTERFESRIIVKERDPQDPHEEKQQIVENRNPNDAKRNTVDQISHFLRIKASDTKDDTLDLRQTNDISSATIISKDECEGVAEESTHLFKNFNNRPDFLMDCCPNGHRVPLQNGHEIVGKIPKNTDDTTKHKPSQLKTNDDIMCDGSLAIEEVLKEESNENENVNDTHALTAKKEKRFSNKEESELIPGDEDENADSSINTCINNSVSTQNQAIIQKYNKSLNDSGKTNAGNIENITNIVISVSSAKESSNNYGIAEFSDMPKQIQHSSTTASGKRRSKSDSKSIDFCKQRKNTIGEIRRKTSMRMQIHKDNIPPFMNPKVMMNDLRKGSYKKIGTKKSKRI